LPTGFSAFQQQPNAGNRAGLEISAIFVYPFILEGKSYIGFGPVACTLFFLCHIFGINWGNSNLFLS